MSRSTRLLIGVLLILSVVGVMGVALLNEDDPRTFQNSCVIAALLMVTGLFVVITTLRVKLPPRVRGRAGMRLSPKRLVGGLGAVVGCIVVWLVSMSVLGVSKRGVLMLPVLGVPVGLLTAASAWAVACTRCSRRFDLEQLHTAEDVQATAAARAVERGDPVALARVLGGARKGVAMNEANLSPIVLESCGGCSRVAFARRGGASAWFLDGDAEMVIRASRKAFSES